MKKILSMILVVALMTTMVAGCGTKKQEVTTDEKKVVVKEKEQKNEEKEKPAEKVKIRFMGYNSESSRATYLKLLAEKLPNIEVQFEFVANDNFSNILNSQLAAGNAPDIIEGGSDTKLLANAGYLLDLTDQEFVKRYMDVGLKSFSVDGKVYATPLQSWFQGIFYNKKIFKENNLEAPKSLDEFIGLLADLEAKGIKPIAVGAADGDILSKNLMGMALNYFYNTEAGTGFDESFNKGEGKLADNWTEASKQYVELMEKMFTPDMLGISADQAKDEFATGKAAMFSSGPWDVNILKEKNPDLELAMFSFQGETGKTGWLIGGTGSCLEVNANSKHTAEALQVLDFTATPEAQAALIKDNTGSSYLKGVKVEMDSMYDDCQETFQAGNIHAPWVGWTAGTPVWQTLCKSLQEVLAGTKEIEQVLIDADEKNAEILESITE